MKNFEKQNKKKVEKDTWHPMLKKQKTFCNRKKSVTPKRWKINMKRFNFLCLSSSEGHVSGLLLDWPCITKKKCLAVESKNKYQAASIMLLYMKQYIHVFTYIHVMKLFIHRCRIVSYIDLVLPHPLFSCGHATL